MEANLAVDFLVYPLLPLMDGSDMLCHVTLDINIKHSLQDDDQYLSGEHFVAVGAGDALDPAVLGLPHVDVADVRAEVGLGAEYPHTEVTPLVDWATSRAPALGHWTQLPSQGRGHTLLLLRISSLYYGCDPEMHLLYAYLLDVHRCEVHAIVGDVVVDDVLLLADEGCGGGGGEEARGAGDAGGQGDQLRR